MKWEKDAKKQGSFITPEEYVNGELISEAKHEDVTEWLEQKVQL